MIDSSKREQIITAYNDAEQECLKNGGDDSDGHLAAIQIDVPDATVSEIVEALRYNLERTRTLAKIFKDWAATQRKAGRPESEIILGNCIHELNLWRPSRTN